MKALVIIQVLMWMDPNNIIRKNPIGIEVKCTHNHDQGINSSS